MLHDGQDALTVLEVAVVQSGLLRGAGQWNEECFTLHFYF